MEGDGGLEATAADESRNHIAIEWRNSSPQATVVEIGGGSLLATTGEKWSSDRAVEGSDSLATTSNSRSITGASEGSGILLTITGQNRSSTTLALQ